MSYLGSGLLSSSLPTLLYRVNNEEVDVWFQTEIIRRLCVRRVKVEEQEHRWGLPRGRSASEFFFFIFFLSFIRLSFSVSSFDLTHFSGLRQVGIRPPREQIREGQPRTADKWQEEREKQEKLRKGKITLC